MDVVYEDELPDYLNDLNAMCEAVSKCDNQQLVVYGSVLKIIIDKTFESSDPPKKFVAYCEATATQRAKALLQTIGKWVEE